MDGVIEFNGTRYRNGTLLPHLGYVCAFPPTAASPEIPIFNDDEIRQVITDPNRRKPDILFPASQGFVSDQKNTSACAGHATAGALTRARILRGLPPVILSGSYLYSKSKPAGQDNGSTLDANHQAVEKCGSCAAELCTANMIHPNQQPRNCDAEASKHKGLSVYHAPDKRAFRSGVAAGFMANVVVTAGKQFSTFTKINGLDRPCNLRAGSDGGGGNHSICCVDMMELNGVEYFLCVNSWTASYGAGGYVWLTWDSFAGPFANHPFFFVTSSAES
jgi:C1A family cysteine protease